MFDDGTVPAAAATALEVWLGHHDRLAPGLIEGLYLLGSAALGDWSPRSDIDVIAFTADAATPEDVERLRHAHEAVRAQLTGIDIDGPYLAWGDITTPPLSAQRPWTLHDEFRYDGDCFEINPVTWYTLAAHGIVVRGVAPAELDVHLDRADRAAWVRENVDTYWRNARDQVAGALAADPNRGQFDADVVEWCALGVARMAYSDETGGVTSKRSAGAWAVDRFPGHAAVLAAAIDIRRTPEPGVVDRDLAEQTVELMTEVVGLITG